MACAFGQVLTRCQSRKAHPTYGRPGDRKFRTLTRCQTPSPAWTVWIAIYSRAMKANNEVLTQYIQQGYDCIPLKPLSKLPFSKGWQTREPFQQWRNASEDANFGLRAGNGKAFIDCDDKNQLGTSATVTRWLDGLGYQEGDYPMVQTPSGGNHVYVNFTGSLLGSKRNLSIGSGEFRYNSGAYVAAPPSVVETGIYKLLEGNVAQLPTLDIHDIAGLINPN